MTTVLQGRPYNLFNEAFLQRRHWTLFIDSFLTRGRPRLNCKKAIDRKVFLQGASSGSTVRKLSIKRVKKGASDAPVRESSLTGRHLHPF